MPLADKTQPIIVKKVYKKGGHHGGAWKIAFADFMTAMMAFFLLMWLIGSTDAVQKGAISEFFRNPSAFVGVSQSAGTAPGDGQGNSPSLLDLEGAIDMAPPQDTKTIDYTDDASAAEALVRQQDLARLGQLEAAIENAVDQSQNLLPYKDQLLIDLVPEGLRIQIVDKENRPMFNLGSPRLLPQADSILRELAAMINQVPNRVAILGHTDSRPYTNPAYTNWELSADRANAARRALIAGGMLEDKIGRVVGLASSVHLDPANPDNPLNRRISILVMTRQADASSLSETGGGIPPPLPLPPAPPR